MKSLKNYSKNSFTFVNSIQSFVENKSVFGQDLLFEHGAAIDSIFSKCKNHINRLQNPYYITESDTDVLFTLDEQYAARDIFVNIAEEYKTALYNEFCLKNNLDIDVYAMTEGIQDRVSKISNSVKEQGDKLKGKFDDLTSKIKGISDFIKEILDKGIKSVEDFLQKFEDFMINLKDSLKNLIVKIVGDKDIDTLKESFFEQYKEALQSEVKTKEAIPCIMNLLDSEDETKIILEKLGGGGSNYNGAAVFHDVPISKVEQMLKNVIKEMGE